MTIQPQPSAEQQQRAKWDLLLGDIELRAEQLRHIRKQARWETPKAIAMIALALAAIIAAGRVADLVTPARPQTIVVHLAM
jgi:hypothetical protein